MTHGFDKRSVIAERRELDWKNPQLPNESALAYARHYGIDFQHRLEGVAHGHGHVCVGEYAINTHIYYPEKPRGTVLIVHGYYDHVGLFRHIIEHVLRRGFAVVAYDLPGHGLSSGDPVSIPDFAVYQEVLDFILQKKDTHLPRPWYVVAQSTGAAIIIDHLMNKGESSPFARSILLAPLVRPVNWRLNKLLYYLISPFRRYVRRKLADSSSDHHFLEFVAKHDPLQSPVLSSLWVGSLKRWISTVEAVQHRSPVSPVIIQGTRDGTVDWRHNMRVLQRLFTRPEIHYLQGARHHLANENQDYRAQILRIIDTVLDLKTPNSADDLTAQHGNETGAHQ